MLGWDPVTYTLRDAGKGFVVSVDDGVAVWSALRGRPSLFGKRVRSGLGLLMAGSFLRMTGYGEVDRSLFGKIKKATSGKECGLKSLMMCRFPTLVLSRSGIRVVQNWLDISAKKLP
jgi:hypothetical protein